MPGTLAKENLERLSAVVASRMGLHFPGERLRDLERGIDSAARELGFEDTGACVEWLLSSPLTRSCIEVLASHLTVGETFFFRDGKIFQLLEEVVLPELIGNRRNNGKRIRIWSAGCATGEEPYTIAMFLDRMIADLDDWNITILATDINPRFLHKAAEGLYRPWSFRDPASRIKKEFFNKKDDLHFKILPRIREMVTFSYLNLAENVYPSPYNGANSMDIIFCRNVLMYLAPECATKVVQNLRRCLLEGGCLVVSPSELSCQSFAQFAPLSSSGATIYRKVSNLSPAVEIVPFIPPGVPIFSPAPSASIESNPEMEGLHPESPPPPAPLPDDLRGEALALYEAGRYTHAMEKAEGILSHYPADAAAMELLARIHANCGKLEEALNWCEKAIAADKLRAGSHYLAATILLELGQAEAGADALKRALYLDPGFVPAYVALGNISRQRRRHRESIKYFENALTAFDRPKPGRHFAVVGRGKRWQVDGNHWKYAASRKVAG